MDAHSNVKSNCRAYLQTATSLRSFYWFESAADQSIYFGSSNAKYFKNGRAGVATVEKGGTRVRPEIEGRPMSGEERRGKTSIHGSGIVNLAVGDGSQRQRYSIAPPRDGFGALPLVAVIPMQPSSYPSSHKTPKATDLVLPLDQPSPKPIGILFYLGDPGTPEPPAVTAAKLRLMYEPVLIRSAPLGNLSLYAFIYKQRHRLRDWPPKEITLLAPPPIAGQEPNWPFFG